MDISFIPFANGASGYIVPWKDLYLEKEIFKKKKLSNINVKELIYSTSKILKNKVSITFVGYFEEILIEYKKIKKRNKKNTPHNKRKDKTSSLESNLINLCTIK